MIYKHSNVAMGSRGYLYNRRDPFLLIDLQSVNYKLPHFTLNVTGSGTLLKYRMRTKWTMIEQLSLIYIYKVALFRCQLDDNLYLHFQMFRYAVFRRCACIATAARQIQRVNACKCYARSPSNNSTFTCRIGSPRQVKCRTNS